MILRSSGNFTSMEDIKRNLMIDLLKFIYNKKILNKIVIIGYKLYNKYDNSTQNFFFFGAK